METIEITEEDRDMLRLASVVMLEFADGALELTDGEGDNMELAGKRVKQKLSYLSGRLAGLAGRVPVAL